MFGIGFSHLTAIEHGAKAFPELETCFVQLWGQYEPFSTPEGLNPALIDEVRRKIEAFQPDVVVASILGGESFGLAFSWPGVDFDYHSPSGPFTGETLIPASLVSYKLREVVPYLAIIDLIAGMTAAPIIHALPPPPCGDEDEVRLRLPPSLTAQFAGLPMPNKRVHAKLWKDLGHVLADNSGSAIPLSPPEAAMDEDGFLKVEFLSDAVHGTSAYGELVIAKIHDRLAA